jgi:predicted aminopeptidase
MILSLVPASPRRRRDRLILTIVAAAVLLSWMQGCYYMQAAAGQLEVMRHRRPLNEVIEDPATPATLAERLRLLQEARRFASEELFLPDNDSYRSYADLQKDYVVWNVVAAPEFSLQPKTWCYLIVGCVAYRGYFSGDAAQRKAEQLKRHGYDVFVGGVSAYSTLGRFADPLLSTMMQSDDRDLISVLFHELAHQLLYIKDDTEFNESFASAVAEIGLSRWAKHSGEQGGGSDWCVQQFRRETLTTLLLRAREDLGGLYESELPETEMRARKQQRLNQLEEAVAEINAGQPGWLGGALNNARLASLALYRGTVAAFLGLLERCNDDLPCFYSASEKIAKLPQDDRRVALDELQQSAVDAGASACAVGGWSFMKTAMPVAALTGGISLDTRRVSPDIRH